MDEKTNLYVFEKKEVALIFIFMILMAITAFILGVKVGKDYSFANAGYTPEDRARVDLLSKEEEKVNKMVQEKTDVIEKGTPVDMKSMHENLERKIREELDGEGKKMEVPKEEVTPEAAEPQVNNVEQAPSEPVVESGATAKEDPYKGKFTIQLGSHRSLKEAEEFAEGFKVRGYNPIINEAELPGRGIWYRVSLGVFKSVTEAKEYVIKEKSLFEGQDYVIARFD